MATNHINKVQLPNNDVHVIEKGIYKCTMETTSTSTAFVVTSVDGLDTLWDGLTIFVRNSKVASASGCTLKLGTQDAKPIWLSQSNAACTTHWGVNQAYMFVYDATNERWELQQGRDTNDNTDVKVRQTLTDTGNVDYKILFSQNASAATATEQARKNTNLIFNPSTSTLTSPNLEATTKIKAPIVEATTKVITPLIGSTADNGRNPDTFATYDDIAGGIRLKGTFTPSGDGAISGGPDTLKSVANKVGDLYIADSAVSPYLGVRWDIGDQLYFIKDVAAGTAPTSTDIAAIEKDSTWTDGSEILAWNTSVTLGTIDGHAIKAKLPANPNGYSTLSSDGLTVSGATKTINHYAECSTGASTAVKIAVPTGTVPDTLVNGTRIVVYFINKNTANSPMLSIKSADTTGKPIFKSTNGTMSQITTGANKGLLDKLCTFYYTTNSNINSGQGAWILSGDGLTTTVGSASTGTAIAADDITAWSDGTLPSLTITSKTSSYINGSGTENSNSDGSTGWYKGSLPTLTVTSKTGHYINSNGSAPSSGWSAGSLPTLKWTDKTIGSASGWGTGSLPSLKVSDVSIGSASNWSTGTLPSLTVTSTTVGSGSVSSNNAVTTSVSNNTLVFSTATITLGTKSVGSASGWRTGTLPSLTVTSKTAHHVDSNGSAPASGWSAGSLPSLTITDTTASYINNSGTQSTTNSGWSKGSLPSLKVSDVSVGSASGWNAGALPVLKWTDVSVGSASGWSAGAKPSLSYTARSIPNISVSSKTVMSADVKG